jgi:outer membrane protein, heavy metal efflux system
MAMATVATMTVGCYHAQPIYDQDVVAELRRQDLGAASARVAGPAIKLDNGLDGDEAVAVALVNNPDLRALRAERAVADGQVIAASALENPTIRLEMLHGELVNTSLPATANKPAPTWGWGVGLAWNPPQPVELSAKKAFARARVTEVDQVIRQREWELGSDVRGAHATVAAALAQILLADDAVAIHQRIVGLVEKRVATGASTRIELNLASLSLVQAQRDRDELEAQRAVATSSLAWLLGVANGTAIKVPPQATDAVVAPSALSAQQREAIEDRALLGRPSLRAAKARYVEREQSVRIAYARRWPWFQLAAFPRYRRNNNSNYPDDWTWAIDVSLPILNWNTGNIRVAEAERAKERESYVAELATLRRDLAQATAEVETRARLVKRYQDTVLPALANHDKLLELAIGSGQLDIVALLAAEQVVLRSRREYQSALLDYRKACLALDRAVGEPVGISVSGH